MTAVVSFDFDLDVPTRPGQLLYVENDMSLDFRGDPRDEAEFSLAVGTVQLQVGRDSGLLQGCWGYFPKAFWKAARCEPGAEVAGGISVAIDEMPPAGVAVRLAKEPDINTRFDEDSGWLCLTWSEADEEGSFIEFATGCVAQLVNESILAVWLRPTFV